MPRIGIDVTETAIKLPPQTHRALLKAVDRMLDHVRDQRGVMLVYPSPTDAARQMLQGDSSLWLDYSTVAPVNPHLMEVQFLTRSRFQRLLDDSGQAEQGLEVLHLIDAYDPRREVLVAIASSRVYLWSRDSLRKAVTEIREFETELLDTHRMPEQGVSQAVTPEFSTSRSDDETGTPSDAD